jgi:TIR domain
MSGGIFISYRREDSAGFAGRIYDQIASQLDRERVFFDVDNIDLGADFIRVLSEHVAECDALVAIIGKQWLAATDEENRRRLDNPDDFVRIEIETALQRGIPVIPVLVGGAVMPRTESLPETLKALARRNGLEISHANFDSGSERLTKRSRSSKTHASSVKNAHQTQGAVRQGGSWQL